MNEIQNDRLCERLEILSLRSNSRTYNALRNAGVVFVAQLVRMSEKDLLKTSGIGKKGLEVIKEALTKVDLTLGTRFRDEQALLAQCEIAEAQRVKLALEQLQKERDEERRRREEWDAEYQALRADPVKWKAHCDQIDRDIQERLAQKRAKLRLPERVQTALQTIRGTVAGPGPSSISVERLPDEEISTLNEEDPGEWDLVDAITLGHGGHLQARTVIAYSSHEIERWRPRFYIVFDRDEKDKWFSVGGFDRLEDAVFEALGLFLKPNQRIDRCSST